MILKKVISSILVFQMLTGCMKIRSIESASLIKTQFSISGRFLISAALDLIIPGAYAVTTQGELIKRSKELEKESAIAKGKTDGLEAKVGEVVFKNPRSRLFADVGETTCASLENHYDYNSCPAGAKCAVVRRAKNINRRDRAVMCGLILDESRTFKFNFTATREEVFQKGELEVFLMDSEFGYNFTIGDELTAELPDMRSDLIQIERNIQQLQLTIEGLNESDPNFGTQVNEINASFEEIMAMLGVYVGRLDGAEARLYLLENAKINLLSPALVSESQSWDSVEIDEERVYHWNQLNRFDLHEVRVDPWNQAIYKKMNIQTIVEILSWGLANSQFGQSGDYEYDTIHSFIDRGGFASLSEDYAGKGMQYLRLLSLEKGYSYDLGIKQFDEDVVPTLGFKSYLLHQIAIEKWNEVSEPIIPISKMIEGIDFYDVSQDHERVLLYFFLAIYLKHARDMGFDLTPFQPLIDKYNEIKESSWLIVKQVLEDQYMKDIASCDYTDLEDCKVEFKKYMTIGIVNDYFGSRWDNSNQLNLIPEDLKALYFEKIDLQSVSQTNCTVGAGVETLTFEVSIDFNIPGNQGTFALHHAPTDSWISYNSVLLGGGTSTITNTINTNLELGGHSISDFDRARVFNARTNVSSNELSITLTSCGSP